MWSLRSVLLALVMTCSALTWLYSQYFSPAGVIPRRVTSTRQQGEDRLDSDRTLLERKQHATSGADAHPYAGSAPVGKQMVMMNTSKTVEQLVQSSSKGQGDEARKGVFYPKPVANNSVINEQHITATPGDGHKAALIDSGQKPVTSAPQPARRTTKLAGAGANVRVNRTLEPPSAATGKPLRLRGEGLDRDLTSQPPTRTRGSPTAANSSLANTAKGYSNSTVLTSNDHELRSDNLALNGSSDVIGSADVSINASVSVELANSSRTETIRPAYSQNNHTSSQTNEMALLSSSFKVSNTVETKLKMRGPMPHKIIETNETITYEVKLHTAAIVSYSFPIKHREFTKLHVVFSTLEEALQATAIEKTSGDKSHDSKYVILVTVCHEHIDMAINLYEVSFLENNLTNYLFLCLDSWVCDVLNQLQITAFLLLLSQGEPGASPPGIHSVRATSRALELGTAALVLAPDTLLLGDPHGAFSCQDCDLHMAWDGTTYNFGCYFSRPTNASRAFHAAVLAECGEEAGEACTGRVLARVRDADPGIKVQWLSEEGFPSGRKYFEQDGRMWAAATGAVALRNDGLGPAAASADDDISAAKVYRLKEHAMWSVDKNAYYSRLDARYLTYINLEDLEDNREEIRALQAALWLAHLLNRSLVLPVFSCPQNCSTGACEGQLYCAFSVFFHVGTFHRYFQDHYRENFFLSHHKVPTSVKSSISETYYIRTNFTPALHTGAHHKPPPGRRRGSHPAGAETFVPGDVNRGATWREVLQWFGHMTDVSVLQFQSLYKAFDLDDPELYVKFPEFALTLQRGLVGSDYRQARSFPLTPSRLRPYPPPPPTEGPHEAESRVVIGLHFAAVILLAFAACVYKCVTAGCCDDCGDTAEEEREYEELMHFHRRLVMQRSRYYRGGERGRGRAYRDRVTGWKS